jgi:tetratricopeptide (TPR) repeat protein
MVVIPSRWRISPVCEQYRDATPLFMDGGEAIAWLDSHLPHIQAVLDDAVDRGWDELAWQVCEALWELFLYRKHYREWIRSHEIGIAAAARCGHQEAESRLRCQLARAFLDLHRFDDAERECLKALELAQRTGSRRNESVALDQLGMVAQGRGDVETAVDHFQQSLLIEQELGIERGVALRHRRIGDVLLDAGRDPQAGFHLRRASEMFATLSDVKAQARVEVGLARIDARTGEIDRAVWRLRTALDTFRTSGSAIYQVDALLALAQIATDNGDRDAARPYLSQALELCHEVGGPHLEQVRARLAALDGSD